MAVISRASLLVMAIVVVLATVANAQLAPAPAPTSDGYYPFLLPYNFLSTFLFPCTVIFNRGNLARIDVNSMVWDFGRKLQCSS
jgi:hypothetical protein